MVNGKHRGQPSRWRRRILGIPVVGWLIGLGGTALAIAGFIVLLGASGSITAGDEINVSYRQSGLFEVTAETGADCSVVRIGPGEIQITATNVYPVGSCTFNVAVENGGAADARLQRLVVGPAALDGTVGTCGQTVAAVNGQAQVSFTLTFPGVTAGQNIALNPAQNGLEWVAAPLYNAGQCNT
jgi:hypothetical protein